ncbi:MAG TPA: EAL domain-containing protein [Polyangiaceae bacterium]|nr:EAL domain-containing protein [Polyangiaceae bacterium]
MGRQGVYPAKDAFDNPLEALSAHAVITRPDVAAESPVELRPECLTAMGIALLRTDAAGFVRALNPVAEQLTGWSASEAVGKHVDAVFELGAGDGSLTGPLSLGPSAFPTTAERADAQPFLINRQGRKHAITYSVDQRLDESGKPAGTVILAQDITEARLNSLRLLFLSSHDALTGLLNRTRFLEQLGEFLRDARAKGESGALLYIDIDRFRMINQASGYDAGDSLLDWLGAALREAAAGLNATARLGGNEFGVLLYRSSPEQALDTAQKLQRAVSEFRFAWRDTTFAVRASIGVVPITDEHDSVTTLLTAAEDASRKAKDGGGARVFLRTSAEDGSERQQRALDWVARIKHNLERDHVQLYCQNIVPLYAKSAPTSYEVLFRMLDAEGVARGPQDVVTTAEQYGLMDQIDRFIIKQTMRTLGKHRDALLDSADHWSINLSASSLRTEAIFGYVHEQLAENGVPPSKICFEITETAAVQNLAEARWLMHELHSIGCRFSLDDFGSGMASYAYLRDLPVNYIKVDRSFVKDVDRSELCTAIVESIQHIAELIGAKTVAEGVETKEIAEALRVIGVDFGQGWLFGRPGPIAELARSR